MSDLTDERIAELVYWSSNDGYGGMPDTHAALLELQRRRAEQAAGREHVERVVSEVVFANLPTNMSVECQTLIAETVAKEVADRLSVPVLSAEERSLLFELRDVQAHAIEAIGHLHEDVRIRLLAKIALLDRLIAAGKP